MADADVRRRYDALSQSAANAKVTTAACGEVHVRPAGECDMVGPHWTWWTSEQWNEQLLEWRIEQGWQMQAELVEFARRCDRVFGL